MPLSFGIGRGTRKAGGFFGGLLNASSIQTASQIMLTGSTLSPTAGGSLIINGESLGSYDYLIRNGSQTVSSFTASDWFTSTEDSRSAWIVVNGDMTINGGITFTPSVRKLFTVLYVQGNLTVNGTISMTARGANHSGTGNSGGATTAANIRIINGTYSGVTNPQVPAAGGAGGIGGTTCSYSAIGGSGSAGSGGGTGGGGAGELANSTDCNRRAGSGGAGTSFTGGSGGGSRNCNAVAGDGPHAVENGGAGGAGGGNCNNSGGGAGNPGGAGSSTSLANGASGTGGVLIIFCTGTISGSGSIVANGSNGGWDGNSTAGGSSGGGSITILRGSGTAPTVTANGGVDTRSGYAGNGGAGTARVLSLV